MKILRWIGNNSLFLITLFLLAFIPLYPKIPLLDVMHTWVYVRIEDVVVALALIYWAFLMFRQKITFKTPLTMPIIIFWIIGAIATLHGILLIFPNLQGVFPNVALLNYLRRIEYVSLFFIGFSAIKDKKLVPYIVSILAITLLAVSLYGIGQKYAGFPAFLTMNEEFAKGTPIRLSALSRVSSTFGGHYDLAAYIVLVVPILMSMLFGFKNWIVRFFLLGTVGLGFVVLFMTVSRVSFFVLFLALVLMLFFHKRRLAIYAIISLFLMGFVFLSFSSTLLDRFGNTVKEVDVLVNAQTGEAIGHVKEVPSEILRDKIIKIKYAQSKSEIDITLGSKYEEADLASNSALIINFENLPKTIPMVDEPNAPTGENLPQGTGYINLALTPISTKIDQFFYQKSSDQKATDSADALAVRGNFLIKRVVAYDLSFTTRFQGEWPRAMELFKKNILFGGGYSSTGLAVDNNYLRILGEVGLLGFIAYFGIFILAGIYIKRLLPQVDSMVVKSFVFGLVAGVFGLILNAVFIDVFEASKIAFSLWLLLGVTLGILYLYKKDDIDLFNEFKKTIISSPAMIIYLFIAVIVVFSGIINNYFVGDDFTWFKWAADCSNQSCKSLLSTIFNYFTEANGFFYRPGTKTYFLLMYSGFWLNQTAYHVVSILLHFVIAASLFLIVRKVFKSFLFSTLAAFLFIIISGYSETVFWISSTGLLFNAAFVLISLLSYILWTEKKRKVYFAISLVSIILSLLFHELGIVSPLLILLYKFVFQEDLKLKGVFRKFDYAILFIPLLPYAIIRFIAQSHWFNGDYSYNIIKMPFNFIGNTIGYFMLDLFGINALPIYEKLRIFSKGNILFSLLAVLIGIAIIIFVYRIVVKKLVRDEQKIVIFGFMFFVISLLPFLGLGNITSRYSYLSSTGFILIFVFFLKKFYSYMIRINGRDISLACIAAVISIYTLVHIIQLQKVQLDWKESGKKVERFIISLNEFYTDDWKNTQMNFYFVNTPMRQGDAWIFPVGLADALWFVSQNSNIKVYQLSSVEEALEAVKDPITDRVFEFDGSGALKEYKKPQSSALIPIN